MTMKSSISRRDVLKGAGGVAAAGIGVTVGANPAFARQGQGGSGVVACHTWERHRENPDARFKIIDRVGFQTFACNGNERRWACYRIEFEDQPSGETHNLYVNPNRRVDTTEGGPYPKDRGYEDQEGYTGWHEFTENAQECNHFEGTVTVGGEPRDCIRKVSFKPTDDSNGPGRR